MYMYEAQIPILSSIINSTFSGSFPVLIQGTTLRHTDKSHGISLIIHVKFHKYNNQDRFTVIAGLLELQINPHNSFSGVTQATAAKK